MQEDVMDDETSASAETFVEEPDTSSIPLSLITGLIGLATIIFMRVAPIYSPNIQMLFFNRYLLGFLYLIALALALYTVIRGHIERIAYTERSAIMRGMADSGLIIGYLTLALVLYVWFPIGR